MKVRKIDFRKELSRFGYNSGNAVDVDVLVNQILPKIYERELIIIIQLKMLLEMDEKKIKCLELSRINDRINHSVMDALKKNTMDFREELAIWGYNEGNSVDVKILLDEILPKIYAEMYGKEDLKSYGEFCVAKFNDKKKVSLVEEYFQQWVKQFKNKQP